ncbi:MAG: protein kinase [Pirellulaceae bacterium]
MPTPRLSQPIRYQSGQEVVPGHKLRKLLGRGMAGEVWEARASGGLKHAIKIVYDLSGLGGQKEIQSLQIIKNLNHPNLCPIFGFWLKDSAGNVLEESETVDFGFEDSSMSFMARPRQSDSHVTSLSDTDEDPDATTGIDTDLFINPQAKQNSDKKTNIRGQSSHHLVIAMQLGDCTLFQRLQQVRKEKNLQDDEIGGIDRADLIDYMGQAASALDWLNHTKGIVHCDVKPQNMLLVGSAVQVCDFGLANRMEGDSRMTQHPAATPAYAPPEVLEHHTYTTHGDQYSLAISYYELRTNCLPFTGNSGIKIATEKIAEQLKFDAVTPGEREVLNKATKKDHLARYESCSAFVKALERVYREETEPPPKANWKLNAVLVAGLVVALGIVLYTSVTGGSASLNPQTRLNRSMKSVQTAFDDKKATTDSRRRGVLLDNLSELNELYSDELSPELKQQVRSQQTAWIALTLELIEQGLDKALVHQDAGAVAELVDDLNRVDAVIPPSNSDQKDDFTGFRAQSLLCRYRIELATSPESTDPTTADQLRIVRSDLPESQQAICIELLALSWLRKEPTDPILLAEPAIADVATFHDRTIVLPEWKGSADRWRGFEQAFTKQMHDTVNAGTDPQTDVLVGKYFPGIVAEFRADDQYRAILSAAVDGNWKSLSDAIDATQQGYDGKFSRLTTEERRVISGLQAVADSLKSTSEAGAVAQAASILSGLPQQDRQSIAAHWATALGRNWLQSDVPPSGLDPESVSTLLNNLDNAISPQLDFWLLCESLPSRTAIDSPELLDPSIERLTKAADPFYKTMAEIAEIEKDRLRDVRVSPAARDSRLKLLENAKTLQPTDTIAKPMLAFWEAYIPYVEALAIAEADAAAAIDRIIAFDQQRTSQLAPSRRQKCWRLISAYAEQVDSIADDDISRLRYSNATAEQVARLQAAFTAPHCVPAKEAERYQQQFLLAVAQGQDALAAKIAETFPAAEGIAAVRPDETGFA